MSLKQCLIMVSLVTLVGSLSLAFADDAVLDKARQKYDANQAAAGNPTTAPKTTPQPNLAETTHPESDGEPEEDGETAKDDHHFFVFQWVPSDSEDYSRDTTVFAFSPIMCNIGRLNGAAASLLIDKITEVHGFQAAVIGNTATTVSGIQGAAIYNIGQDIAGVQGAGSFNIARDVNGVQAAGIFNAAGDLSGLQAAGILNIAKHVRGCQFGLVNLSDDMDGIALGLVNYCRNGIHELASWYEGNGLINAGILNGSKIFYTIAQAGMLPKDVWQDTDSLSVGLGFGFRLTSPEGLYVQTDLSTRALLASYHTKTYHCEGQTYTDYDLPIFPSLRLIGGFDFGHNFGFFGGATINFASSGLCDVPTQFQSPWSGSIRHDGHDLTAYATWVVGVSLL